MQGRQELTWGNLWQYFMGDAMDVSRGVGAMLVLLLLWHVWRHRQAIQCLQRDLALLHASAPPVMCSPPTVCPQCRTVVRTDQLMNHRCSSDVRGVQAGVVGT